MQSPRLNYNSTGKQEFLSHNSKIYDKSPLRQSKQLKKVSLQKKNPEQQEQQLKNIVKQYLKGKNIEELKNKFYNERLLKKRNRVSIDFKKSNDQIKQNQSYLNSSITKQNKNRHNSFVEDTTNEHHHLDQHHYKIFNHFKDQSDKFKQCTCGAHYCETNQIKIKFKDPVSKFQSNYTMDTKQAKIKSKSHAQRPQITASYLSSQIEQLPQYSPKFQTLNLDSSYKAQYPKLQPRDKLDSFKYLKMSNVKFGPKQVKNFESCYQKQYSKDLDDKYASKTPQPFVVREPQNLNAFGLRYHSINSKYQKDFEQKKNGQRDALKPPSLFKDLNLQLIKQSSYKEAYNGRTSQIRTSRKQRIKKQKIPIVHHLSSSFIPLDNVAIDSELLNSSYKKDYIQQKNDVLKYYCPHGLKSSNGAISKY